MILAIQDSWSSFVNKISTFGFNFDKSMFSLFVIVFLIFLVSWKNFYFTSTIITNFVIRNCVKNWLVWWRWCCFYSCCSWHNIVFYSVIIVRIWFCSLHLTRMCFNVTTAMSYTNDWTILTENLAWPFPCKFVITIVKHFISIEYYPGLWNIFLYYSFQFAAKFWNKCFYKLQIKLKHVRLHPNDTIVPVHKRKFLFLEKCKKVWHHLMFSQKSFLVVVEKAQKIHVLPTSWTVSWAGSVESSRNLVLRCLTCVFM